MSRSPLIPLLLHLEDRRMQLVVRLEAVQQLFAALLLGMAGIDRVRAASPPAIVAGCAMLVIGATLLITAARELRGSGAKRLGWLSLIAGIALLIEWADSYVNGGKLIRPALVMGVLNIALGLFHPRLEAWRKARRRLCLDGDAVDFRLTPLRRFRAQWTQVSWIEFDDSEIRVQLKEKRTHRIPLHRLDNAAAIANAMREYAQQAGVEIRTSEEPTTGDVHA